MKEERMGAIKRLGTTLLKAVLFLLAVTAVIHVALSLYANKKEKEALAAWEKAGYSLDNRYQAFAGMKDNDRAGKIKELGVRLGIYSDKEEFSAPPDYANLQDYLKLQLEKEKPEFVTPEKPVADKLEQSATALAELRGILEEGPPSWAFDESKLGHRDPILLPVIQFERLLCAETLFRLSRGEGNDAARNLEAGLRLAAPLKDSGMLIDSLIYVAAFRMIAGTARFLPSAPDPLLKELSSADLNGCIENGFVGEAAIQRRMLGNSLGADLGLKPGRLLDSFLGRPYLRLCAAGMNEASLEVMRETKTANPCQLSDLDISSKILNNIPKWNIIARIALPNLQEAWVRGYRATLERDLSILILKARALKAGEGKFPDSMELPKSICPGASWKYSKNGDHCSICFDGEFKSQQKGRLTVPLKWEE